MQNFFWNPKNIKNMETLTEWTFRGEIFKSRRHIKDRFKFSTSVIDAKIRDKEIVKITKQVTTDEKLHYNL